MKPILGFFFLFSLFFTPAKESFSGDNDWALVSTKNDIEVYTRNLKGSNLKELKMKLFIEGSSISEIIGVFSDTQAYPEWVYKCSSAKMLEVVNDLITYDYFVLDFPWPLSDRDLVTKTTARQDPETKAVILDTRAAPNHKNAPSPGKMVRITNHHNQWVLTPKGEKKVEVVYFLNSSPGGNIPDWLVNLAIDYGPSKTIQALREMLQKEKYKDYSVGWLK